MGATAGALTGDGSAASVNTAALTAANAVQNNYLETRDLKDAIRQLESCKVGCDSLRRLLLVGGLGGVQRPAAQLENLCNANPQGCALQLKNVAQVLQELQSPEVRAVLGASTADRLVQRQINDLGQALNALQWGVEHMQSSTAIMKGALMVGATAAGAGVLVHLGRALVTACGSGIGTPACNGLVTELSIGVAEAASGAPTLGVSAPVVGVAAARLSKTLAQTSDPAAVAAEMRAVLAEAKGASVANGGVATGTVFDSIKATQPTYPGSAIPRSFEMTLPNGQNIWVAGNATEHMAEFAQMKAVNYTPEAVRLASQEQLTSLQAAVNTATKNGVPYNQLINIGGWELKFAPPRQQGQLPSLIHALPGQ
jgi:hypothetical protein